MDALYTLHWRREILFDSILRPLLSLFPDQQIDVAIIVKSYELMYYHILGSVHHRPCLRHRLCPYAGHRFMSAFLVGLSRCCSVPASLSSLLCKTRELHKQSKSNTTQTRWPSSCKKSCSSSFWTRSTPACPYLCHHHSVFFDPSHLLTEWLCYFLLSSMLF